MLGSVWLPIRERLGLFAPATGECLEQRFQIVETLLQRVRGNSSRRPPVQGKRRVRELSGNGGGCGFFDMLSALGKCVSG